MNLLRLAVILLSLLAAAAGEAEAQSPALAPPSGFSRIGGAVFVSATGAPEFGIGYPLAEWGSIFHRGHGTFMGLMSKDSFGLGLGHRFTDYRSAQGEVVSFTIGPAYTLRFEGKGLRSGSLCVFAVVSFHVPPKGG